MQISLTNKGLFVLTVCGISIFLYLFSDNNRTGYETSPDVVSLRRVFVAMVTAVEEAGGVIRLMHNRKSLNLQKKPALLQLGGANSANKPELVTEADLISNYVIIRRIKLLRPDFTSQINSEEREMPQRSSMVLAMKGILSEDQVVQRQKILLSQLPEQDVFLHLRQISLWVDPLDATQEFSENLLNFVSVMGCAAIHGEPMFGVVHFPFSNTTYWSSLGSQLSENLRGLPKATPRTLTPQEPLRILVSRSHNMKNFSEKLRKAFGSTPIQIIPAGGSGYKMMKLAIGAADLYIHAGGARRWDICGPATILQTRGGVVRTLKGDSITFNHLDPSDLNKHAGIFAAASRELFDTWSTTVASFLDL